MSKNQFIEEYRQKLRKAGDDFLANKITYQEYLELIEDHTSKASNEWREKYGEVEVPYPW